MYRAPRAASSTSSKPVSTFLFALLICAACACFPAAARAADLLDDVLEGKEPIESVRISVQWSGRGGGSSAHLYGNGVGVWNGQKQFKLDADEVKRVVGLFRRYGFASLPEQVGSPPGPPDSDRPLRVVGSVALSVGQVSREVTQVDGGARSKPLAALATEILKFARDAAARNGVGAEDMADGLGKIAAGELAPETLHVLVHRLVEAAGAGGAAGDAKPQGFLMRLEGRTVTTQPHSKAKGYAAPVRLELTAEELADVCKLLADNRAGELPINLWATHYTDVVVKVLDKEKNMQARQFAGMTPETHGDRQKDFDRVWEGLYTLHRRVLDEGKSAEPGKQ